MAIEIYTPVDFYNIRNDLSADYILMNDIDLSVFDPFDCIAPGHEWSSSEETSFSGTFDGQGYTVSNAKVRGYDAEGHYGIGIFGMIDGGIIENLNIENADVQVDIDGYGNGILAYYIDEFAILENVHIKNSFLRTCEYSAGLVAFAYVDSQIINCSVEDTVIEFTGSYEAYDVGGLVGAGASRVTRGCKVKNVVMRYTEETPADDRGIVFCGGLMGYVSGGSELDSTVIEDCMVENFSLETVEYIETTGGSLGIINEFADISRCGAINVDLTTDKPSWNYTVGGFAGWLCDSTVTDCFATGKLQQAEASYNDVGGFVGVLDIETEGAMILENCYSAVEIIESIGEPEGYTGGFCGYYDTYDQFDFQHIACYYDKDLLADGIDSSYGGVRLEGDDVYIVDPPEARTTAEMTYPFSGNTYVGWDFSGVWYIYENYNDGYPVLEEREIVITDIYFLDKPQVKIQQTKATVVTVKSPTAEYTARLGGTTDYDIERMVEIKEGSSTTCRLVAERLLEVWSKRHVSVTGKVRLNMYFDFLRKERVLIPEANLIGALLQVQKIETDIIAQETKLTLGDTILSDNELLARILQKI